MCRRFKKKKEQVIDIKYKQNVFSKQWVLPKLNAAGQNKFVCDMLEQVINANIY